MNARAIARKSLDRRLGVLRDGDAWARPPLGWVRAIRDALGLTGRQLAGRMGISQATLSGIEQGEVSDTVTLATLRRAAEALDCQLVYALVPRRPLDQVVRDRAERIATAQIARVHHSMRLEDQALRSDDLEGQRQARVDELLRGDPRRLWTGE